MQNRDPKPEPAHTDAKRDRTAAIDMLTDVFVSEGLSMEWLLDRSRNEPVQS